MNTLSIPHHTSPEGTFRQGAASPKAAPQGEASPSIRELEDSFNHQCAQLERDWKILVWSAVITAAVAMWLVIYHPAVFAVAFCIALSAATIVGIYCWAAHRGDTEIGVSDTQGRDTTNTNL